MLSILEVVLAREAGLYRGNAPKGRQQATHSGIEQPSSVSVAHPHRARPTLLRGVAGEPEVCRPRSALPLLPAAQASSQACESGG